MLVGSGCQAGGEMKRPFQSLGVFKCGRKSAEGRRRRQPLNKCERRSLFGTLGEIVSGWLLACHRDQYYDGIISCRTVIGFMSIVYCVVWGRRRGRRRSREGNKQIVFSVVT